MQVDERTFVVNSLPSLVAFIAFVKQLIGEHLYITFTWRIGADRSLDQNALFHVWLDEYAAHIFGVVKKKLSKAQKAGMKKAVKRDFYLERGHSFMVVRPINPRNGQEGITEFTSSADYSVSEMFEVLTWLQMRAANDGLVLESKGQFNKLQREAA